MINPTEVANSNKNPTTFVGEISIKFRWYSFIIKSRCF